MISQPLSWMSLISVVLLMSAVCGRSTSAASVDPDDLTPSSDIHTLDATNPVIAKRSSFFLGSRYGRSQANPPPMRNLNVVPRNNRFFTGSRYGKRSGENMQEIVEPEPSRVARFPAGGSMMQCRYTGVKDFYQCSDILSTEPNSGNRINVDSNSRDTSGLDADK